MNVSCITSLNLSIGGVQFVKLNNLKIPNFHSPEDIYLKFSPHNHYNRLLSIAKFSECCLAAAIVFTKSSSKMRLHKCGTNPKSQILIFFIIMQRIRKQGILPLFSKLGQSILQKSFKNTDFLLFLPRTSTALFHPEKSTKKLNQYSSKNIRTNEFIL